MPICQERVHKKKAAEKFPPLDDLIQMLGKLIRPYAVFMLRGIEEGKIQNRLGITVENAEKMSDIKGDAFENGFGSHIRSYFLQPYTLVKDSRTGAENGDAYRVLDGDIDLFINAYLVWITAGTDEE